MIGAVDVGYGYTKGFTRDGGSFLQPSVIGEKRPVYEEALRASDILYDDHYFVGDLAVRHSDIRYTGTKEDKAATWTTAVLLRTALAAMGAETYDLVTGLPVDFYFTQRERLQNLLQEVDGSAPVRLRMGRSRTATYYPRVRRQKIVPQPLGAAMDYLLDDAGKLVHPELARRQVLVVDLGYFTLDLLILDRMEMHRASCSPPGLGVDTAYKLLQQYLKDAVGSAPARYDLDRYVLANEYQGYDIQPLVQKAFQALAAQVQLEIEALNMKYAATLLVGGAAKLIAPYLDLENVVYGDQGSNARGYLKIGARTWGAGL